MEIWTAVVLSSDGRFHGTCVGRTEEEVWDAVTEQFDPENEWAGTPKDWGSFAEFFQYDIHPNPHDLPGLYLSRDQLDAWAGTTITDDELERLDEAIPNSSIPDAVNTIVNEAIR